MFFQYKMKSFEEKKALINKVKEIGVSDLRKLAPIGNLGTINGWSLYWGNIDPDFPDDTFPELILKAFWEQKELFGYKLESEDTGYRKTWHLYGCDELGLYWEKDSSD